MKMTELFELENEYFNKFSEHFPNATVSAGMEAKLINEALKTGKPYKEDSDKIY